MFLLIALNFGYINVCLLETLFGEKAAQKIIEEELKAQRQEEEVKNSYALKENKLRDIIWKDNPNNVNEVIGLLNFQNLNANPPISWTDPKTNITVKLTSE